VIISLGSRGASSRSVRTQLSFRSVPGWLNSKNPASAALRREAGEEWGARKEMAENLILKRASASRPSGDVLADGVVVGRIMKAAAAVPGGMP